VAEAILVLNAGSSSLKFALHPATAGPALLRGQIDGIGRAPRLIVPARGLEESYGAPDAPPEQLLARLLTWLEAQPESRGLIAAAHRVVHGGADFAGPVRVTADILDKLEALSPLAPLHQPHNLAPIRALIERRPQLAQTASFDTAFHRGHAPAIDRFALPGFLYDQGVRRYGFHGLSYAFVAGRLDALAPDIAHGRVIIAHLGAGASLCAIADGRSIDTTMGFSALDGLPMATRCGALDPGVILHLLRTGMPPAAIESLLYNKSGLKGVSGLSGDMRDLLASADPRAAEAVALFVHRCAREIAALTASLGGLDGLVFTAGIGEHAAPVRALICARLGFLGVTLDPAANATNATTISARDSRVRVLIAPTNEEAVIAADARAILANR
jgi:acetate kinase